MIINKGSRQLLTIKENNKTDANTYYFNGHIVKQRQNTWGFFFLEKKVSNSRSLGKCKI